MTVGSFHTGAACHRLSGEDWSVTFAPGYYESIATVTTQLADTVSMLWPRVELIGLGEGGCSATLSGYEGEILRRWPTFGHLSGLLCRLLCGLLWRACCFRRLSAAASSQALLHRRHLLGPHASAFLPLPLRRRHHLGSSGQWNLNIELVEGFLLGALLPLTAVGSTCTGANCGVWSVNVTQVRCGAGRRMCLRSHCNRTMLS